MASSMETQGETNFRKFGPYQRNSRRGAGFLIKSTALPIISPTYNRAYPFPLSSHATRAFIRRARRRP